MTKRAWGLLLLVFESTWLLYVALLMPVMVQLVMRGPQAELRESLVRLSYVLPVAGVVTILAVIAGFHDIRQRSVPNKALWVLGFAFLGVVAFPLYCVFHVWAPARSPAD